ncbi:hypothetical protein GQ43DRAFT_475790 [Delitschia confertaspora ATCC 74209]|uniref:carbonic anhydrase n=1 Tax=Delitschia confertaspora ATCC 74209 TaxID=1513339 RepID=A0A9P4MUG5_9PLEO|nr:hypothetical protein GQ43DRAFT_475790 [Delitschia confertaspora ATCC 74209]
MLNTLPNELLSEICGFLDTSQSLRSLSLTCRKLHDYTKLDGWKAFLRGRFVSTIPLPLDQEYGLRPSDARNIVHGLTTLYRNWDRKAFLARYIDPSENNVNLRTWQKERWWRPRGQTMGYQPVIDSYDEWMGGEWASRREVLTWGAGNHIVMRVKGTTPTTRTVWKDLDEKERGDYVDNFNHLSSWYTWEIPDSVAGADDITALKILRPDHRGVDGDEQENIVFGTASGHLSTLHVDMAKRELRRQAFDTKNRFVGTISVSPAKKPFIAASLDGSALALYPVTNSETQENVLEASSEVDIGTDGQICSSSFIRKERVAIGLRRSVEPIQVYEITPTGLTSHPIRKFHVNSLDWAGRGLETVQMASGQALPGSVYAIIPLPNDATGSSSNGQVFLSGGYDGVVRLHDMRSSNDFEITFADPTNDSAIFALQAQGQERLIAGTAQHCMLRVYDIRLSGSCAYHSSFLKRPSPRSNSYSAPPTVAAKPSIHQLRTGWNTYLTPTSLGRSQAYTSPVYSLSLPSPTSPFLYAGVEQRVVELTFTSILDKHSDPIFAPTLTYSAGTEETDVKQTWDRLGDVENLGMYEWDGDAESSVQEAKRVLRFWMSGGWIRRRKEIDGGGESNQWIKEDKNRITGEADVGGREEEGGEEDPLHRVLSGNQKFAQSTDPSVFTVLAAGQSPEILWIGCADSRVPETTICSCSPGDIFVHRNIANCVNPGDLSVAAVVEYAVVHLKVKKIVVCGHTGCGGAAAALGDGDLGGVLNEWLGPLRELRRKSGAVLERVEEKEKGTVLAELNVKRGVDALRAMDNVKKAEKERGLEVHGVMFDLASGCLKLVDEVKGGNGLWTPVN